MANNLLKGLSVLYDMELNDYLMSCTIERLNDEINSLGNKGFINAPKYGRTKSIFSQLRSDFMIIFGKVGCVIGAIIGIFKGMPHMPDSFFSPLIYGIKGLIKWFIIGLIVDFIVQIIFPTIFDKRRYKKHNEEESKRYKQDVAKDEARVRKEIAQRDVLIKQRDLLVKKQKESYSKLVGFYNTMDIDKNYRNLIPIGYMYELCRLGVSNKLKGTDGLYYLVRQELRGDRLQYTLDEISSKLDTIISNQSEIYYEINDMNNKCDSLISQTKRSAELVANNNQLLETAVKNTSMSNYRLQRIQTEIEYQNTMKWITNNW